MSKSRLKAEDIFFGLQKAHENETRANKRPEVIKETQGAEETGPEIENHIEQKAKDAPPASVAKAGGKAPEKKKRGPKVNPDNSNRVSISLQLAPEVKYTMVSVINEMKMRGFKDRYTITDFVVEAIEEKIKRTKKQLDMD